MSKSDDLISRQAAIDAIFGRSHEIIKARLKNLPSAQPEIVRCKDCKHREVENGFCEGRGWPMQLVPDDGFCDKGRKENRCRHGSLTK